MERDILGTDYAHLRAFVTVAEHGSFSRAAEQLGISPSALSQTIRTLEERMGVRLLNRTTRSVAPTPAGAALLQRLRPAMDEIVAAVESATRLNEVIAGAVRIHVNRLAADVHLRPVLGAFAERHPQITLDITVDDAVVDIVAGGYDVAIRLGEVIERDMISLRLGPALRQIAVASPSYIAAYGAPDNPRDLHAHRCIRWRWAGRPNVYNWTFVQDGTSFEVAVDGPLIVNERPLCSMPRSTVSASRSSLRLRPRRRSPTNGSCRFC